MCRSCDQPRQEGGQGRRLVGAGRLTEMLAAGIAAKGVDDAARAMAKQKTGMNMAVWAAVSPEEAAALVSAGTAKLP